MEEKEYDDSGGDETEGSSFCWGVRMDCWCSSCVLITDSVSAEVLILAGRL